MASGLELGGCSGGLTASAFLARHNSMSDAADLDQVPAIASEAIGPVAVAA